MTDNCYKTVTLNCAAESLDVAETLSNLPFSKGQAYRIEVHASYLESKSLQKIFWGWANTAAEYFNAPKYKAFFAAYLKAVKQELLTAQDIHDIYTARYYDCSTVDVGYLKIPVAFSFKRANKEETEDFLRYFHKSLTDAGCVLLTNKFSEALINA